LNPQIIPERIKNFKSGFLLSFKQALPNKSSKSLSSKLFIDFICFRFSSVQAHSLEIIQPKNNKMK
jgi:hypothetical protein